jgi:hypothetical protein
LPNLPASLLDSISDYPFYLSPDFSKYLDLTTDPTNPSTRSFVIKDTKLNKVLIKLPQWLMSLRGVSGGDKNQSTETTELKETLARFKWRDNKSFYVVNSEGVERLIGIKEVNRNGQVDIEEINFHVIPLYQPNWSRTNGHYYFD